MTNQRIASVSRGMFQFSELARTGAGKIRCAMVYKTPIRPLIHRDTWGKSLLTTFISAFERDSQ